MPDFARRAQKALRGELAGEQFLFAAVVQPPGSFSRASAEDTPNLFAAITHSRRSKTTATDETVVAGRIPTKNGYLAVTDRRVLWLNQKLTLWPGEIVAEFAPEEISAVEDPEAMEFGNYRIKIAFSDDSTADLVVARSQKPDELVAALRQTTD